jgi:two-component system, OmpR family, sensor histidine kinase QseC
MSLRARLLLTLGVTLMLLWSLAAAWLMRDLEEQFVATLDQRLAQSARMVSGLMAQLPEEAWLQADQRALSIPPIEGLACQVHSPRGEILARTHTDLENILRVGERGHSYREADGVTWRVFVYERDGLTITTADRMDERNRLLRDVIKVAVVPFLVALLGSLVALWFGVVRGLAPLDRLRESLAQRHPDALEPVAVSGVPSEIRPLVDSLNGLLARVHAAFIREQRFTNDAAHELRTPLTATRTHLQVAQRVEGPAAKAAMVHAEQGVVRLSRTLDQLLLLARVEGRVDFEAGEPCLSREVFTLALQDADPTGRADVELLDNLPEWELAVPRELAITALRNLIENALRHGVSARPLVLGVDAVPSGVQPPASVTFRVRDHGPGVEAEALGQLTGRFWRTSKHQGSGLGLAIVAAIVERFGGGLQFVRPDDGGLEARLTLPVKRRQEVWPHQAGSVLQGMQNNDESDAK